MSQVRAPAPWAYVLLWTVPALWSTNFLVARWSGDLIGPHALALARWLLALVIFLPWVGRPLWQAREVVRQEWWRSLLLGALGMWICGAIVYLGGHTTSATNIALIYAVSPVAIAVLSLRLMGERMGWSQRLGMALSVVGVLYVIAKGDWQHLAAIQFVAGDAWIVLAAIAWTGYSLGLKFWPSRLPPLQRLALIMAGGVLVMVPLTLAEWLFWPAPAAAGTSGAALKALGLVVLAAVVPGALSYGAYTLLQRELGAARTALMLYLGPVYGALLGWLFLGEPVRDYHWVGAALILPSIWLATRR